MLLFAVTLFLSAALLFLVQPMIAKMLLPLLGGTPAVWNTCMVFFQAGLLAGYAYAHATPAWLGVRRQALFHAAVLLLPVLTLPIALPRGSAPPADADPIPWLLAILGLSIGLPFFVVSTSAPLLQSWFAATRRGTSDPYFLYSASNLGSVAALLAYPLVVEPRLRLAAQGRIWAAGYGLLVALTWACAALVRRRLRPTGGSSAKDGVAAAGTAAPGGAVGAVDARAPDHGGVPAPVAAAAPNPATAVADAPPPGTRRRLHWLALAFVPSSLMLGVTTYLTTDVAAVPLFWVVPLVLYLVTFILAFAGLLRGLRDDLAMWLPALALLLAFSLATRITPGLGGAMLLHLGAFFVAALLCHGELARTRPPARHLTEFYLWLSLGGVLGGLFNALVAPLVFSGVTEYPVALVLACMLVPPPRGAAARRVRWADLALPAALGLASVALQLLGPERLPGPAALGVVLRSVLPFAACFLFILRPVRFGLGLGAVLAALALAGTAEGDVLHRERSFFGVLRVTADRAGGYHRLVHGNVLHGQQSLELARRTEPLTYYHPTGPIGQVFELLRGPRAPREVALVGLGTGSLASYGAPGQRLTFYEIDPAVLAIAENPAWFTYLRDSRAELAVVLGDARLRLAEAGGGRYGLIVLDAFSSDAIPVHLLTREALRLYLAKLADGGLLAFHISNRYLSLEPVVGNLARDAGLQARVQHDKAKAPGKSPSTWVVMARSAADLGALAEDARWRALETEEGDRVWTDDFSNLFEVLRWGAKPR